MKTIILKSLHIINFKRIKQLDLNFEEGTNMLFGANESGKTTIADANRWLLTGMDSQNRADFEIKPTDRNGNKASKIENSVTAIYNVNGRDIKLTRVNKEKWVTRRGSAEEEFKGNESHFFVDDVPMNMKDYQARVYKELMDLEQIKILTDPTYFNLKINWQDRRRILTDMAGDITNDQVLIRFSSSADKKAVGFIQVTLSSGKSFTDRKKEIEAKRKLAKDEKETIPTRIDEATKAIPVPLPFERIKEDIQKLVIQLEKIDNEIADSNAKYESENQAIEGLRTNIRDLNAKLFTIENKHIQAYNIEFASRTSESDKIKKELEALNKQIQFKQSNLSILTDRKEKGQNVINSNKETIEKLKINKDGLLAHWKEENAKQLVINPSDCQCPTCKQDFPADMLESKKEEMLKSFNNVKKSTLEAIVSKANSIKAEIEGLENKNASYLQELTNIDNEVMQNQEDIKALEEKLHSLSDKLSDTQSVAQEEPLSISERLANDTECQSLKSEIAGLNEAIQNRPGNDNTELVARKREIQTQIDNLKADLVKEDLIKQGNDRIEELKEKEKTLAQEIANYEAEVFAINQFLKVKMEMVQESVNNLFSFVKFRMYRELVNGGEEPCCDCLVDGIEYEKNLNTANKVNAGIDVINALSKHYGVSAPIWIDNRESVTNVIHTENQLINLIVNEHNLVPSSTKIYPEAATA